MSELRKLHMGSTETIRDDRPIEIKKCDIDICNPRRRDDGTKQGLDYVPAHLQDGD